MPGSNQVEWITIQAAAELLKVNHKTIRRRIADGTIEGRRFGPRVIRISLASLEAAGRPIGAF